MNDGPTTSSEEAVGRYKTVQRVIDNRPSGTRWRLGGALGKNRSFILRIHDPGLRQADPGAPGLRQYSKYATSFLMTCGSISPPSGRPIRHLATEHVPAHTICRPDSGNDRHNGERDRTVGEFVQRLTKLIDHT